MFTPLFLEGAAWLDENYPANKTDVWKEVVALNDYLIASINTPLCDTQNKINFCKSDSPDFLPCFNHWTECRLDKCFV